MRQPSSSATSSDRLYADARSAGSPRSPSRKTGPTAWMTYRAGSRPAPVAFASPVAQPPSRAHSSKISSPPARRIAPQTPAAATSASFAALTIASTRCSVRSPTTKDTPTRSEERVEPDREAGRQRARPSRARAARPGRTPRARSCRGGSSASPPARRRSPPGARRGPEGARSGSSGRFPSRGRRLGRSGGRVALRLRVQLDDLGARKEPRRLLGEAHHQDRALREVRRVEARRLRPAVPRVERLRVEAASSRSRPAARRAEKQRSAFAATASGRVKSTAASQPSGPRSRPSTTSCPAASSAGASADADLPVLPEDGDAHSRRPRRGATG